MKILQLRQGEVQDFIDINVDEAETSVTFNIDRYGKCKNEVAALLVEISKLPNDVKAQLQEKNDQDDKVKLNIIHDFLLNKYRKIFQCIEYGPMIVEQWIYDSVKLTHAHRFDADP